MFGCVHLWLRAEAGWRCWRGCSGDIMSEQKCLFPFLSLPKITCSLLLTLCPVCLKCPWKLKINWLNKQNILLGKKGKKRLFSIYNQFFLLIQHDNFLRNELSKSIPNKIYKWMKQSTYKNPLITAENYLRPHKIYRSHNTNQIDKLGSNI